MAIARDVSAVLMKSISVPHNINFTIPEQTNEKKLRLKRRFSETRRRLSENDLLRHYFIRRSLELSNMLTEMQKDFQTSRRKLSSYGEAVLKGEKLISKSNKTQKTCLPSLHQKDVPSIFPKTKINVVKSQCSFCINQDQNNFNPSLKQCNKEKGSLKRQVAVVKPTPRIQKTDKKETTWEKINSKSTEAKSENETNKQLIIKEKTNTEQLITNYNKNTKQTLVEIIANTKQAIRENKRNTKQAIIEDFQTCKFILEGNEKGFPTANRLAINPSYNTVRKNKIDAAQELINTIQNCLLATHNNFTKVNHMNKILDTKLDCLKNNSISLIKQTTSLTGTNRNVPNRM